MNIFDDFSQLDRAAVENNLKQAMGCFPWRPSIMGDRIHGAYVSLLALSANSKKGFYSIKEFQRNLVAIARTMIEAADEIQKRDGAGSTELPKNLREDATTIKNLLRTYSP